MAASQELAQRFREMTVNNPHQISSDDQQGIIDTLIRRVESGGMVVVNSEIYPVEPVGTEFADIVLPAAAWGEHDAARCNGERRLRLYSKFYDPPGEARPDWWAISRFAQKMGFEGFAWETDNEVFEEAARFSRGGILDYFALVWKAKKEGQPGHEALRQLGTTGIQCPIRVENGELVGTKRLHDSTLDLGPLEGPTLHSKWLTHFRSHSSKALFIKTPWELFSDFYERIKPDRAKGEFWITTGRVNEVWQSLFDDQRKPYIANRWPDTFAEINPVDATEYNIESGDEIRMFSDDILIQTRGFNRIKADEISFTWLLENGHIRIGHGEVITNRYRFKLGKGQIEKLGESPFKNDFSRMSFKPRDII
jgi:arsenite oxidase large subunit